MQGKKKEALGSLADSPGWIFFKKMLEEKKKAAESTLLRADPNNSTEIAKLQERVSLLEEIIEKPEIYLNKLQSEVK